MTPKDDPKTPSPAPADADAPRPSRRGLVFVALGLLLAGFILAIFAAVYRPDYVVLVEMDDQEEGWFRRQIADFAEKRHIKLTTRSYKDGAELERLLRAEALERKSTVLLCMVPRGMLTSLVEEDLVRSIEDLVGFPKTRALVGATAPAALAPAKSRGRLQYAPATISVPLLFWSKAHLADAVAHWSDDRPRIEAAIKRANGAGLPTGYRLEDDPNDWDTYDVAVVAAYWAGRPYDGLTVARVAHVAAGDAAVQDLASRAFALGAHSEELLELDGVALRDALAWESTFFKEGWYHPSMASENWEPRNLLTAAAQGQVFLGWLDSAELFRLHGTGTPELEGFLKDPADLGVARVPRGVSLDIDRGQPARAGDPLVALGGTWWGIPRTAPEATLASELAKHLSEREFQEAWARAYGRLPARRDLLAEIDLVFETDWQFAIARTSKKQAFDLARALPASARWRTAEKRLVSGWREACATQRLVEATALGTFLQTWARGVEPAAPAEAEADSTATQRSGD